MRPNDQLRACRTLTSLALSQGSFTLTEVTLQAVDSPGSLPLAGAALAALVLLHGARRRQPSPKALA